MTNDIINTEVQTRQTGFTLIEALIVIVLAGILATYAASRWTNNTNLNAQAQQLAAAIRYTQALSMTHNSRFRLIFTLPNSYAVATITGSGLTKAADPVTNQTTITLANGMAFGTITNLPNNLILFDGLGNLYVDSGGTTALTSNAVINITWGNETRQVQISPAGQVQVQ